MVNQHYATRAAVLRAMDDQQVSYRALSRRLGWPLGWLTARLGGRGPLTFTERRLLLGELGLELDPALAAAECKTAELLLFMRGPDLLEVYRQAVEAELEIRGYLYTITCCGFDLEIFTGAEAYCPGCRSTFRAGAELVDEPAA